MLTKSKKQLLIITSILLFFSFLPGCKFITGLLNAKPYIFIKSTTPNSSIITAAHIVVSGEVTDPDDNISYIRVWVDWHE